jgi:hypothetical protein
MYRFKRSLIALMGVLTLVVIVTVSMPHIGRGASGNNAPTTQTQNVNVVNTPNVAAQQNGIWNVGINGTPSVNVASMPNTPLPIAVPTPQTILAFTETRNYHDQPLIFGPYDVSAFKDVRLSYVITGNNCQGSYTLPTSDDRLAFSENFGNGSGGSTLVNVPGQKISFFALCQFFNQGTVTLEVYGRP